MIVGQVIIYGIAMMVCLVCLVLMVYDVLHPYSAIVIMCDMGALVIGMHFVIFMRKKEQIFKRKNEQI